MLIQQEIFNLHSYSFLTLKPCNMYKYTRYTFLIYSNATRLSCIM